MDDHENTPEIPRNSSDLQLLQRAVESLAASLDKLEEQMQESRPDSFAVCPMRSSFDGAFHHCQPLRRSDPLANPQARIAMPIARVVNTAKITSTIFAMEYGALPITQD